MCSCKGHETRPLNSISTKVYNTFLISHKFGNLFLNRQKKLKIPFKLLPSPLEKHSDPEYVEGYDTHPKEGNPS